MDPRRPKRLNEEQKAQVQREAEIKELSSARTRLYAEIRSKYGSLKNADEAVQNKYQKLEQILNSSIRAGERALLKEIKAQHDAVAPVSDIQQQLNGISPMMMIVIRHQRSLSTGLSKERALRRPCL